jgi:chemotaxis protein methyltransferase CheR
VTAEDIAYLVSLCRTRAGLKLAPEKTYYIESRLAPVARRENFGSVADLMTAVRERHEDDLIWAVVEAMAAGETSFFRDRAPFREFGAEIMPQLLKARAGAPIRVWSAACGSGQEVYSLAMIATGLQDADPDMRIEFAASDLSRLALEKAQNGLYNQFEVQRGLPVRLLVRYFEKEGDQWRLSSDLRQRVRWRRINLVAGLRNIGRFDVVFCRYSLGHMTEDAQRKVLEDLTCIIPEDGYLVLGLNEQIPGLTDTFEPVIGKPGLYRRNPAFQAAAA